MDSSDSDDKASDDLGLRNQEEKSFMPTAVLVEPKIVEDWNWMFDANISNLVEFQAALVNAYENDMVCTTRPWFRVAPFTGTFSPEVASVFDKFAFCLWFNEEGYVLSAEVNKDLSANFFWHGRHPNAQPSEVPYTLRELTGLARFKDSFVPQEDMVITVTLHDGPYKCKLTANYEGIYNEKDVYLRLKGMPRAVKTHPPVIRNRLAHKRISAGAPVHGIVSVSLPPATTLPQTAPEPVKDATDTKKDSYESDIQEPKEDESIRAEEDEVIDITTKAEVIDITADKKKKKSSDNDKQREKKKIPKVFAKRGSVTLDSRTYDGFLRQYRQLKERVKDLQSQNSLLASSTATVAPVAAAPPIPPIASPDFGPSTQQLDYRRLQNLKRVFTDAFKSPPPINIAAFDAPQALLLMTQAAMLAKLDGMSDDKFLSAVTNMIVNGQRFPDFAALDEFVCLNSATATPLADVVHKLDICKFLGTTKEAMNTNFGSIEPGKAMACFDLLLRLAERMTPEGRQKAVKAMLHSLPTDIKENVEDQESGERRTKFDTLVSASDFLSHLRFVYRRHRLRYNERPMPGINVAQEDKEPPVWISNRDGQHSERCRCGLKRHALGHHNPNCWDCNTLLIDGRCPNSECENYNGALISNRDVATRGRGLRGRGRGRGVTLRGRGAGRGVGRAGSGRGAERDAPTPARGGGVAHRGRGGLGRGAPNIVQRGDTKFLMVPLDNIEKQIRSARTEECITNEPERSAQKCWYGDHCNRGDECQFSHE